MVSTLKTYINVDNLLIFFDSRDKRNWMWSS